MKTIEKILSALHQETPDQSSARENDTMERIPIEEELERCVLCGETTTVPVSLSVDAREEYVIGVGQLCEQCYISLYHKKQQVSNISDAELLYISKSNRMADTK